MANENETVSFRIDKDDIESFKNKCRGFSKPYQIMIREMIEAFNEGRVRIIPTNEQKESLKIYQE